MATYQTLSITSDANWTATTSASWMTIVPSTGTSAVTAAQVSVTENTGNARNGYITFTNSNGGSCSVSVSQAVASSGSTSGSTSGDTIIVSGTPLVFTNSSDLFTLIPYINNLNGTIEVIAPDDVEWTIGLGNIANSLAVGVQNKTSFSPSSGKGSATVTVVCTTDFSVWDSDSIELSLYIQNTNKSLFAGQTISVAGPDETSKTHDITVSWINSSLNTNKAYTSYYDKNGDQQLIPLNYPLSPLGGWIYVAGLKILTLKNVPSWVYINKYYAVGSKPFVRKGNDIISVEGRLALYVNSNITDTDRYLTFTAIDYYGNEKQYVLTQAGYFNNTNTQFIQYFTTDEYKKSDNTYTYTMDVDVPNWNFDEKALLVYPPFIGNGFLGLTPSQHKISYTSTDIPVLTNHSQITTTDGNMKYELYYFDSDDDHYEYTKSGQIEGHLILSAQPQIVNLVYVDNELLTPIITTDMQSAGTITYVINLNQVDIRSDSIYSEGFETLKPLIEDDGTLNFTISYPSDGLTFSESLNDNILTLTCSYTAEDLQKYQNLSFTLAADLQPDNVTEDNRHIYTQTFTYSPTETTFKGQVISSYIEDFYDGYALGGEATSCFFNLYDGYCQYTPATLRDYSVKMANFVAAGDVELSIYDSKECTGTPIATVTTTCKYEAEYGYDFTGLTSEQINSLEGKYLKIGKIEGVSSEEIVREIPEGSIVGSLQTTMMFEVNIDDEDSEYTDATGNTKWGYYELELVGTSGDSSLGAIWDTTATRGSEGKLLDIISLIKDNLQYYVDDACTAQVVDDALFNYGIQNSFTYDSNTLNAVEFRLVISFFAKVSNTDSSKRGNIYYNWKNFKDSSNLGCPQYKLGEKTYNIYNTYKTSFINNNVAIYIGGSNQGGTLTCKEVTS